MSNYASMPDDVARLICGNVDDLKCYLNGCTDADLVERAFDAAMKLREGKTKRKMLARHLAKLRKATPNPTT